MPTALNRRRKEKTNEWRVNQRTKILFFLLYLLYFLLRNKEGKACNRDVLLDAVKSIHTCNSKKPILEGIHLLHVHFSSTIDVNLSLIRPRAISYFFPYLKIRLQRSSFSVPCLRLAFWLNPRTLVRYIFDCIQRSKLCRRQTYTSISHWPIHAAQTNLT